MSPEEKACLVFAAVVQYNDPDPYAWLVLYLAAAGVSFAALWFPDLWKIPAVVAVGAFVWAATLVPTVTQTSFPDLFQSWEMMSREMEEGREFLGLDDDPEPEPVSIMSNPLDGDGIGPIGIGGDGVSPSGFGLQDVAEETPVGDD